MKPKIKRKIAGFTLALFLINSGIFYPATYVVTEVDYTDDVVVICDANGNLFEFEGCDDWQKGDLVSAIMYNSQTKQIYDDVIVKVKYTGTTKMLSKQYKYTQKGKGKTKR